jgi:hypothetical protein
MYATTRYNFVRLKAKHKISPLEELVGGEISPYKVDITKDVYLFKECLNGK